MKKIRYLSQKIKIIFFVLFLLFCSLFCSQTAFSKDLRGLIELALKQNLTISAEEARIANSELDLQEARNLFIPNLNIQYQNTRTAFHDDTSRLFMRRDDRHLQATTISLVQAYPALGKVPRVQKKIAELKTLSQRISSSKVRQEIIRQVVNTYFSMAREAQTLKIHNENLFLINKLLEIARINQEVGLATMNDILRIEVQKSNIQVQILGTKNRLENLRVDMLNLLNMTETDSLEIDLPESLKFETASIDLALASKKVLEKDYDLELMRKELAVMDATLEGAKSARLPTLSLTGNYTLGDSSTGIENSRNSTAGFTLTAPLYDSGDLSNAIKKAKNLKRILELSLKNLENQKRADIQKAFLNYQEVLERIKAAETSLAQAGENMRVVKTRYVEGDASIIELIDAQITQTNSSLQAISAYYDERLRLSELLFKINDLERISTLHEKPVSVSLTNCAEIAEEPLPDVEERLARKALMDSMRESSHGPFYGTELEGTPEDTPETEIQSGENSGVRDSGGKSRQSVRQTTEEVSLKNSVEKPRPPSENQRTSEVEINKTGKSNRR